MKSWILVYRPASLEILEPYVLQTLYSAALTEGCFSTPLAWTKETKDKSDIRSGTKTT